jgi:predicted MPP superfamily phosphohydrolase
MLSRYARFLPELFSLVAVASAHYYLYVWLMNSRLMANFKRRGIRAVKAAFAVSLFIVCTGIALQMPIIYKMLPYSGWQIWTRGLANAYGMSLCMFFMLAWAGRTISRMMPADKAIDPMRRKALKAGVTAVLASPLAITGFGIVVERRNFVFKEIEIGIPNLPKDLQGLKLVQLTDMHVSPFLTVRELARAVDMANEAKAHVALVTGDLITSAGDPLDGCIRELSRLRADAGVFGCMGNHEVYANCEDYTARQAALLGMRFLRQEARTLRFGTASINLAGVDYQKFGGTYLPGAERMISPDPLALNILLSHNPDVFPVAAGQGWDLTLAGHTHGGQVTFELLSRQLNIARFYTKYVQGHYELGGKSIFVSRGLGTVGVPARIGAPPEVVLIKLCAT